MNDDIRFDRGRSAAWRDAIVENARAERARGGHTRRRAGVIVGLVIAALLISGGGVAYALSGNLAPLPAAPTTNTATPDVRDTEAPSVTPAPAPPPTPTPDETEPVPEQTPDYTVLGFHAVQLYEMCQEAVHAKYPSDPSEPGFTDFLPLAPDTLRDAQDDGAGHVAIFASSTWSDQGRRQVWICEFTGDPANPQLWYAEVGDR
jgi:hypothetical protein